MSRRTSGVSPWIVRILRTAMDRYLQEPGGEGGIRTIGLEAYKIRDSLLYRPLDSAFDGASRAPRRPQGRFPRAYVRRRRMGAGRPPRADSRRLLSEALGFCYKGAMPTVFRFDGLRVRIYPNDHRP